MRSQCNLHRKKYASYYKNLHWPKSNKYHMTISKSVKEWFQFSKQFFNSKMNFAPLDGKEWYYLHSQREKLLTYKVWGLYFSPKEGISSCNLSIHLLKILKGMKFVWFRSLEVLFTVYTRDNISNVVATALKSIHSRNLTFFIKKSFGIF